MKKVLFFIALMLTFGVISEAQTVIHGRAGQQYFKYTSPVTITNDTPVEFHIKTLAEWPTTQHAYIKVDSVSGNHTAIALLLYGRNFDDAAWTSISSTIVDQGVDSDVANTLTNTTETRWRQFKILLTGTGTGVSRVVNLEFLMLKPD
jgi:hypothetical protein